MTTPETPPAPATIRILGLAGLSSSLFMVALSAGFYFTNYGDVPVIPLAFGLAAAFEPMAMWFIQVTLRQRAFDAQSTDLDGYTPPAEGRPRFTPTFITLAAAGSLAAIGLFAAGMLLAGSESPGADAPLFGLWLVSGIGLALYAVAALRDPASR